MTNLDYILLVSTIVLFVTNLVVFVTYRIWRHRAKKFIRGKLYLIGNGENTDMYTELHVELEDLHQMETITLEIVPSKSRKE